MRKLFACVLSTTIVACGVFGASDAPKPADEPPVPPPSTPQDNAQPPGSVGGQAPVGVYVSTSQGADDGTGSSVRPLKTLAKAFALAKERGLRVIACAEDYTENVVMLDGVSAYGYYDCTKTPWERGAPRAVVRAPATPAVLAKGITLPTRLEGFEIRSPDLDGAPATDTVGTTIALEVRGSTNLTVSESLLHGGKGAPGTDGTDGPLNSRTATSNGSPAQDEGSVPCTLGCVAAPKVPGPAGGSTTCAIGPSGGPGGQAGDGRFYFSAVNESTAAAEFRGRPLVATAATAVGGLNESADGQGHGLDAMAGANGAEGTDGTDGAWVLTSTGFVRGNGTAGGPGGAGQGGGGGAGTRAYFTAKGLAISPTSPGAYETATGGGGGGGGCGGQAGTPGTGGGASIGALVIDSAVTFDHARIESSEGGRAGKGNLGTPSVAGGQGGQGITYPGTVMFMNYPITGRGGDGGNGGNGGASGHGAPGPSIAMAYSATRPTLTTTDLAPGPGGAGQPKLTRSAGGTIGDKVLPAVVGVSEAEHQIP